MDYVDSFVIRNASWPGNVRWLLGGLQFSTVILRRMKHSYPLDPILCQSLQILLDIKAYVNIIYAYILFTHKQLSYAWPATECSVSSWLATEYYNHLLFWFSYGRDQLNCRVLLTFHCLFFIHLWLILLRRMPLSSFMPSILRNTLRLKIPNALRSNIVVVYSK